VISDRSYLERNLGAKFGSSMGCIDRQAVVYDLAGPPPERIFQARWFQFSSRVVS
jgi:hypothetical protein